MTSSGSANMPPPPTGGSSPYATSAYAPQDARHRESESQNDVREADRQGKPGNVETNSNVDADGDAEMDELEDDNGPPMDASVSRSGNLIKSESS
jgi:hypothetical protein